MSINIVEAIVTANKCYQRAFMDGRKFENECT